MKRFLIIQTAFLGDVILATPIIEELHRIYPEGKIDVVVRKGNETLLANNPKINQLFVWNKKEGKYKNLIKIIKEIRRVRYEEVITLQRYTSAGIITLFARAKTKIGFDKNTFPWMYKRKIPHSLVNGKHEVERNLQLIQHHGAKELVRPELFPSVEEYKNIEKYQKGEYYCMAPASVWETKKLPISKWEEICRRQSQKGTVYLLGGKMDHSLCETLRKKCDKNVVNLAGELSLLESATLMEKAKMNYVNDSGPLHIASAMNAPTRAFFCSTVPLYGFTPLSDDSKVIETTKKLECRPCTFHGRKECPLGHYDCGNTIDVSEELLK